MPKVEIDYSNTIFYKIQCKNPDIKDIYIGHTTNFVQRKSTHKRSCIKSKSANHNCKVYTIIRKFGGWDNWTMEIIAFRNCADHYAARKIEQQYFEEYNATMNSLEPLPKPKVIVPKEPRIKPEKTVLYCETCNINFSSQSMYDKHNQTNKHNKNIAMQHITPKIQYKFYCEICEYGCSKKGDFNKHIKSIKHNAIRATTNATSNILICKCGKAYKHSSSFYRHKKNCTHNTYTNDIQYDEVQHPVVDPTSEASTVLRLLKQNDEFKKLMTEQYNVMTERHNENVALQQKNQELNQQLIAAIKDTTTRPTTVGPTQKTPNNFGWRFSEIGHF